MMALSSWIGYVQERWCVLLFLVDEPANSYCNVTGKREFGLSDKDIASLPWQGFVGSRKTVYSVTDLAALAKRKYEKTFIPYPKLGFPEKMMQFIGMTKTTEKLTGLQGREDQAFLTTRRY